MNPNSQSLVRLKEIIESKQIPKAYKDDIFKSYRNLVSKVSQEDISLAWNSFFDTQRGTGIVHDIQREFKYWDELSSLVGVKVVKPIEPLPPRRKQTLIEYFLQLRSSYKNLRCFSPDERIHLEVAFTYIALECEQVAYKRDQAVMKLAWDKACEIMDRNGMDYKSYIEDMNEVNIHLLFNRN